MLLTRILKCVRSQHYLPEAAVIRTLVLRSRPESSGRGFAAEQAGCLILILRPEGAP